MFVWCTISCWKRTPREDNLWCGVFRTIPTKKKIFQRITNVQTTTIHDVSCTSVFCWSSFCLLHGVVWFCVCFVCSHATFSLIPSSNLLFFLLFVLFTDCYIVDMKSMKLRKHYAKSSWRNHSDQKRWQKCITKNFPKLPNKKCYNTRKHRRMQLNLANQEKKSRMLVVGWWMDSQKYFYQHK